MTNKLPQGWVECELKDVLNIVTGKTPSKKHPEFFGGDIPFVKPGDLDKEKFIYFTEEDSLTKEGFKNAPYLPKHSILVSCIGNLGKKAILGIDGSCNQQINVILPCSNIDYKYVYYYIDKIIPWMKQNASATTVTILNKGKFEQAPFLLPPLNEQKRIVEKIEEEFGKIDEGVEKLKLAQEQIKQYRQSVLKSAFDGKLYKTTEWDKYAIKEVSTNIQYGYTESASSDRIGPKFLRITDIQNNSVNWDKVPYCRISDENKSKYLLKNEDFVFARTGATVGKSYMIQDLHEEAVYASYLIRIGFKDNIETKFIKYYFQTNEYWAQIADNQVGIGQPNVNGTKLGNLTINLPTIEEQKQIVKEIEKRFEVTDKAERVITENLEKAEQLKQAILKKAFEGRLVPQDPTDQPASELLAQIKAERKK